MSKATDAPTEEPSPAYTAQPTLPWQICLNVVIHVVGSRGDVQPFVTLGNELQRFGHRARLATHNVFKDFVGSSGLGFFPTGGDPAELIAVGMHQYDTWSATHNLLLLVYGQKPRTIPKYGFSTAGRYPEEARHDHRDARRMLEGMHQAGSTNAKAFCGRCNYYQSTEFRTYPLCSSSCYSCAFDVHDA